jgi:hypothetical protein
VEEEDCDFDSDDDDSEEEDIQSTDISDFDLKKRLSCSDHTLVLALKNVLGSKSGNKYSTLLKKVSAIVKKVVFII